MSYSTIKWTIFIVLLLVFPAMFFLFHGIMFLPAVFFLAGILYMVPKALVSSNSSETLGFIAIFGLHILIYFGIYYLVSVLIAKLISIIQSSNIKKIIITAILASLLVITQLQIYGGTGGHGPIDWVTLPELFADLNKLYGKDAVITVYGCTVLLIISYLLLRRKIKK